MDGFWQPKSSGCRVYPLSRSGICRQAQLKALRIADNRLAQNAHWDERLLGENLLELKDLDRDFDLSITGFSLPEIDLAIQKLSERLVEDDDASSETGVPVCQAGDVWELGGHRVHCGDATSEAAFEKLMAGRARRRRLHGPAL